MIEKEFAILVKGMKAIYTSPAFIPDKDAFNVWFSLLKDLDYKIASAAIQKHMQTSPYPPTVADIRKGVQDITAPEKRTNESYFLEIKTAVEKSNYFSSEAFEELSDISKSVVISAENLKTWAAMDAETFNSVQKSYLLKAIEKVRKEDAEMKQLSPGLQEIIKSTIAALEGKEAKKIEGS